MHKNQFLLFVSVSLCCWSVVTYFIFLQRPSGSKLDDDKTEQISQHLSILEGEVQRQYQNNEVLLSKLRSLLQRKQYGENMGNLKTLLQEVNNNKMLGEGMNKQAVSQRKEVKVDETVQGSVHNEEIKQFESVNGPVIAVLVFSCNRLTVKRCLDQLLKYRPSKQQFPIIVTQDCSHPGTAAAIRSYGDQLTHIQQPDQSDIPVPAKEKKFKGYFKIARHYGWALNQTFHKFNYDTVIIVEDDLDIAPDFFEYFLATYPVLKTDTTLWCVSAWNDNGRAGIVDENAPELLYRTDFFPGLGWMMTKTLWLELQNKWPKSYWDDWMRQPQQRKDRACIRPEISRTKTFGKVGVSNGLFYEMYLKYIQLNEKYVPFSEMKNLTYLLKDNYDVQFVKKVYDCPVVSLIDLKSSSVSHDGAVRITYQTKDMYKRVAKLLRLMDDFKSGVPRTGYRGIVSFMYNGRRVYLTPSANWKGYDLSWS